ncbi:MAG: hypothetical protein L0271_01380 [Gemmatimonadetes bacterium]|nr:hypothetical protein [Gemmatimonadota bacterium]
MPDRVTQTWFARRVAISSLVLLCACGDLRVSDRQAAIESDDAELLASATRMLRDLERLSGLKAGAPIRVARQSEAELRERLYTSMEQSRTELQAALETYVILGLAPESFDAYTLMRSQVSAIAGYYDHETKQLYVLSKVEPALVEVVLAHELVHAIQDQHVDLGALFAEPDDDKALAFRAAVEGHASLVMTAWLIEQIAGQRIDPAAMPSVADQIRRSPVTSAFALPGGPRSLQRMFYFPYAEGSSFVRTLWQRHPDRLAAGLDTLRPNSTEQILNPERALLDGRDEPLALEMGAPPTGWTARYEATMGEFAIRLALEESLGSSAAAAADGWRGDRLRLLDDGAAGRVLQWVIAWDDDARADVFEPVARRFIESRRPRWYGRVIRSALTAGVPVIQLELANIATGLGGIHARAR